MSFDKIEFVKPNDILQGGFNPNLPAEITVTEQLLYSIANNLAILNNNLINSGALQNLALIGDLMQEVLTDNRVPEKKTSVFKTDEFAQLEPSKSVFIGSMMRRLTSTPYTRVGIANISQLSNLNDMDLWYSKNTGTIVNQATSTYSFNVPVPSVSVSSSPATVNVNASAPVVNNNVPVPEVSNVVNVQSATPIIEVNATAPTVNNIIDVPSVTNQIDVQSATPVIEVNSTAPVVNVSSSPATVNVSSAAPVVNNNIDVPVPSVSVQSAVAPITVSATAPVVNVSSSPAQVTIDAYNDAALIAKLEQVREVLDGALNTSEDLGLADLLEDCLMSEVETDIKMGLADIVFERDNINLIDYPVEMLTEPATTKKLREF